MHELWNDVCWFSFLTWKLLSLSVLPFISLHGRSGGVTFILNFIFGHIFLFESFADHVTGKCLIELVADKRRFSCFLQRQAIGVKVCPPESFAHRHAPKVTRPAMVREIEGVKSKQPTDLSQKERYDRRVLWAVLVLYGSLHAFLKGNIWRNPNTLKVDWMNSCWAHTDIKSQVYSF